MSATAVLPITNWHRPLRDADFHVATSPEDAVRLAAELPEATFLAGGTFLVRMKRWGGAIAPAIIHVNRLDALKGVRDHPDHIELGALTVHNDVLWHPAVQEHAPALTAALRQLAGPAVRNLATIGGNAILDWDLVPPLLALEAEVVIRGTHGERTIALEQLKDSADGLKRGELVSALRFATSSWAQAYQKIARRRAVSRAIAGAAVALDVVDGECRGARIAVGGVGLAGRRLRDAEELLVDTSLDEATVSRAGEAAFEAAADAVEHFDARPWYSREMARVMTERAINQAAGRPVL